jgi:glycosyltransferase involved in cell wall biosynthesis
MKQTVRVPLYAIRHGQIGGTEFAIYNLLKGLIGANVQVDMHYGRESDLSPDFLEWARGQAGALLHPGGGLPGPKAVRFAEEILFQNSRADSGWALFPNYFCPPAFFNGKAKSAVILHDIQYKRYPEYHSAKRRAWLDFYLPRMIAHADSVILISRSELDLVREYFGEAAAERCDVVHNAIDFERFGHAQDAIDAEKRALVKHRYILSVCHQFPHKNVTTLLKAFERVARRDSSIRLYLVGSASQANLAFVYSALPDALRDRVHLTGFVSDAELGQFYANARLFVLPSLYEGFGMPAVEALGMGVPTIVSNVYALPEVTRGYADLIDEPLNNEAWAAAIEAALASGTRPDASAIKQIRETYDPTTIAGSLLAVLRAREQAG